MKRGNRFASLLSYCFSFDVK